MRNPWLCIIIVSALSFVTLGGMAGMVLLAYVGKDLPQAFVAIVSGASGSLASFLVMPPRGSIGGGGNQNTITTKTERTTVSEPHKEGA